MCKLDELARNSMTMQACSPSIDSFTLYNTLLINHGQILSEFTEFTGSANNVEIDCIANVLLLMTGLQGRAYQEVVEPGVVHLHKANKH